jgi:hypothetical protein
MPPAFRPAAAGGRLALRITAAVLGGYALCWALFAALCAWLPWERASVWYLTGQLAPLPFLAVLLWVFAVQGARQVLWPLALAAGLALFAALR